MLLKNKYLRLFFTKIANMLSVVLRAQNNKVLRNVTGKPKNAPLFIIGAPRTGSTFLYLELTNTAKVSYFTNLVHLFHKVTPLAFEWNHRFFGLEPHNCHKSTFGNTYEAGLAAPSEAGKFWRRYFPSDYSIPADDTSFKSAQYLDLQENIDFASCIEDAPLVIKNLCNIQRLPILDKLWPDANWIFIKRNPEDTAKSIYRAREQARGSVEKWFGPVPYNYPKIKDLSIEEQIVNQIYFLEQQAFCFLRNKKLQNSITLQYETIKVEPVKTIKNIINRFGFNLLENQLLIPLTPRTSVSSKSFDKSVVLKMKNLIDRLDWDNYTTLDPVTVKDKDKDKEISE